MWHEHQSVFIKVVPAFVTTFPQMSGLTQESFTSFSYNNPVRIDVPSWLPSNHSGIQDDGNSVFSTWVLGCQYSASRLDKRGATPRHLGDFYGPSLEMDRIHISLDRIQPHGYTFLQWRVKTVVHFLSQMKKKWVWWKHSVFCYSRASSDSFVSDQSVPKKGNHLRWWASLPDSGPGELPHVQAQLDFERLALTQSSASIFLCDWWALYPEL